MSTAAKQILVVEDDAAIRRGIVDALEFEGYRTHQAANGRAGRDAAVRLDCDLLLLDLVLPEADGLDILAEVRQARPTLPVRSSTDPPMTGCRGPGCSRKTPSPDATPIRHSTPAAVSSAPGRPGRTWLTSGSPTYQRRHSGHVPGDPFGSPPRHNRRRGRAPARSRIWGRSSTSSNDESSSPSRSTSAADSPSSRRTGASSDAAS